MTFPQYDALRMGAANEIWKVACAIVCVRGRVHVWACECVCACVSACVLAFLRASVYVHARACVRAYGHVYGSLRVCVSRSRRYSPLEREGTTHGQLDLLREFVEALVSSEHGVQSLTLGVGAALGTFRQDALRPARHAATRLPITVIVTTISLPSGICSNSIFIQPRQNKVGTGWRADRDWRKGWE